MRRALVGGVFALAFAGAGALGYGIGRRTKPTGDAMPGPAPMSPAASPPTTNSEPELKFNNICYVSPAIEGKKTNAANKVMIEMLLDGVFGGKPAQAIVSGECTYWWGTEQYFGVGERARSWDCTFNIFTAGWPPHLAAQDVRGNPEVENWYGKLPQPLVEDRTSLHPLRIEDFDLSGPGQLSIDCDSRTEEFDASPLTSKCKMSWYNKFVPAETHFDGRCGVTVAVRNE